MAVINIKRGLDLPIQGALPSSTVVDGPAAARVALLPGESWGIKVRMLVQEGDVVRIGTPLFCDKRDPEVLYTAPAAGTVEAVNRGARRVVQSVVIAVADHEEQLDFPALDPAKATREELVEALKASGLWPLLRQRPFDKVAVSSDTPRSLFVTAIDTHPLAASPRALVAGREAEVQVGLAAMAKLSGGATWLCTDDREDWSACLVDGVKQQAFAGPHPAGNVGVHIHHLDPVGAERMVWHVDIQSVAEIGAFLQSGKLPLTRRVAVVGPAAKDRAIAELRRGAETKVVMSHANADKVRVVAGSALDGATANPDGPFGFLGRYTNQLTLLDDAPKPELLGWTKPIGSRWSFSNAYLAKFLGRVKPMTTERNGDHRAIVPLGNWEKIMPMDILPTQLIKALASDDLESAEKLGVLELAEEDLALCEFVDASKTAITTMLRAMLTRIEKEG